jgi:hypothetical protein
VVSSWFGNSTVQRVASNYMFGLRKSRHGLIHLTTQNNSSQLSSPSSTYEGNRWQRMGFCDSVAQLHVHDVSHHCLDHDP